MAAIQIEYPTDWSDYSLIDSGQGEKLETFGGYTLVRPDPRALWQKHTPGVWANADASYKRTDPKSGLWETKKEPPVDWRVQYKELTFLLRPTEFKHVGVFPEQAVNWNWLTDTISGKPLKILNLFAYTGGATMAAAQAGAHVTHVDAAKSALDWAHENVRASGLGEKPIRWIEEDVMKFVTREHKRGNTYDGIVMDPPRFGRGTKGEIWKLEDGLPRLLDSCMAVLSAKPSFLLINAYTADISSIVLGNMLTDFKKRSGGTVTFGELALKESSGGRLLPNGIFARWSST